MKTNLKQISKDMLLYGFGEFATKGVHFLLIPLFTRLFTPQEYGYLELLIIFTMFVGILIKFGTDEAQSYYFFKSGEQSVEEQTKYVTAVFQWRIAWGSLITILILFCTSIINKNLFDNQLSFQTFVFAFLAIFALQVMDQGLQLFRLRFLPQKYILLNISYTILAYTAAIVLLLNTSLGIEGYFLGLFLGTFVSVFVSIWCIRRFLTFKTSHFYLWPKLLKFGGPLVPATIATYFLMASDRWCIHYFMTPENLGLYAVGAKFALLITFFVQIFGVAFIPHAMNLLNLNDFDRQNKTFERIFRYYLGLGSSFVIILTLIAPFLIKAITTPNFFSSYKIVGTLAFAAVIQGCSRFSALGTWKGEKTYQYTICVIIAVVFNVIFNIAFIPKFGLVGASWATVIGMIILVTLSFYLSQRSWKLSFNFPVAVLQCIICVLTLFYMLRFEIRNFSSISQPILIPCISITLVALLTWLGPKKSSLKLFYG